MVGIKMYRHWLWMRGRTDVVQCRDFVSTVVIFSCCTMGNVSGTAEIRLFKKSHGIRSLVCRSVGRSAVWLKEKGGIERKKGWIKIIFMYTTFQVCTTFFRQYLLLSLFPFFLFLAVASRLHVRARRTLAGFTYVPAERFIYFCSAMRMAWLFSLHEFAS